MVLMLMVRVRDLGQGKEGVKHPVGHLEDRVLQGQRILMMTVTAAFSMVCMPEESKFFALIVEQTSYPSFETTSRRAFSRHNQRSTNGSTV
jgi:hypothetical protein